MDLVVQYPAEHCLVKQLRDAWCASSLMPQISDPVQSDETDKNYGYAKNFTRVVYQKKRLQMALFWPDENDAREMQPLTSLARQQMQS